jgi:hypothetical protein
MLAGKIIMELELRTREKWRLTVGGMGEKWMRRPASE